MSGHLGGAASSIGSGHRDGDGGGGGGGGGPTTPSMDPPRKSSLEPQDDANAASSSVAARQQADAAEAARTASDADRARDAFNALTTFHWDIGDKGNFLPPEYFDAKEIVPFPRWPLKKR